MEQVLLALSFGLKKAFLLGTISAISIIPTWTFKNVCKDTFEQSYNDAALLQTSELDGWKVGGEMSFLERERYRKWIVDCHKASYVPVCLNAEENYLTSEPAVVISSQKEIENQSSVNGIDLHDQSSASSTVTYGRQRTSTIDSMSSMISQKKSQSQPGAFFRRVSGTTMIHVPVKDPSSIISEEHESHGSASFLSKEFADANSNKDGNEECREKYL